MSILHQKAGVPGLSTKPILLFVLLVTCAACDTSKDFMTRAESLAEKAAYMDSLFAMNREPAEFLKATDKRTMFGGETSPDFDKALAFLKNDLANHIPVPEDFVDPRWREVNDSICFYYCNVGEDAVFLGDSLRANVFPAEGLKWIQNETAVTSRINNSMFDRTLDPFQVLDMLEKTRYLAFINNDCIIYPYAQNVQFFSSFNPGSVRLTIKLFDLTDRSYTPFETLSVFARNSSSISVTQTDHQYNGKTLYKSDNASDRVLEDLAFNTILEVRWAVYRALVSAKKTTARQGEYLPQDLQQ